MATIRTDTNYRKRLIRVGMRPPNLPASRLLPDNWDGLPRTNNPIECRCVNSPFNLKRLIYEHEERKGMLYLYEGLITTYPSDKFADAFLKKVGQVVPDELRSITMDDIGLFEDDDVTVIPNTIKINKTIEAEKSEFIPTDILKEVIEKIDDIVIMNSCLCRTSNNCKDYIHCAGVPVRHCQAWGQSEVNRKGYFHIWILLD